MLKNKLILLFNITFPTTCTTCTNVMDIYS